MRKDENRQDRSSQKNHIKIEKLEASFEHEIYVC